VLYLSGAKNRLMSDDLAAGRVGLLQTPAAAYRLDDVAVWAMDNGCFTDTYPGDDAYLATLDKYAHHQARCLFVAVPDVVGDAAATLALFPAMAARISAAGWPVALVAQDGMTADDLPDGLPWLFIGGSTEWKLGHAAAELIAEAKRRGVRVHVGRVNSAKRFALFAGLDCDTADGTFIAFAPDKNIPQVRSWMAAPRQTRWI
jgi:hypothetical protein